MRWNGIALIGRQVLILLVSLVLANILGPEAFGIVAQANVFLTLGALILDQGLTASLISQKHVSAKLAGAAATLNLLLSLVLLVLLALIAEPAGVFLNTPELEHILPILGIGLFFKALAIVPRMLLTRQLKFKAIAVAEVGSALVGGIAGLVGASLGLSYNAIVLQLVATDIVAAAIFMIAARPPLPNLHLTLLRSTLGFGVRVFIGNLIAFSSRNVDNLLVGKFAGSTQLGYYSLAYRVLLTPIQMIGQTVTRVLFPAIARKQDDRVEISRLLQKSSRSIALAAFPMMALVAVSAPDSIRIFLGSEWAPAVPVLMVLAVTGARQAVTSTNAPLLLGTGRADIHLRFNVTAAVVQIGGIVAGIPFGIIGVAWGYTIAGVLLTPLIGYLQKLLAGTRYRDQLRVLLAPFVGSMLAAAGYQLLYMVDLNNLVRLLIGALSFVVVYGIVLRLFFRDAFAEGLADVRSLLPRGTGGEKGK